MLLKGKTSHISINFIIIFKLFGKIVDFVTHLC